ncbi:MAG: NAD(P)H-binding protein, partial [Myxococcota bacterium]
MSEHRSSERVLVAGATGYIGRHVVQELLRRGYQVAAIVRPRSGIGATDSLADVQKQLAGATVLEAQVTDSQELSQVL